MSLSTKKVFKIFTISACRRRRWHLEVFRPALIVDNGREVLQSLDGRGFGLESAHFLVKLMKSHSFRRSYNGRCFGEGGIMA